MRKSKKNTGNLEKQFENNEEMQYIQYRAKGMRPGMLLETPYESIFVETKTAKIVCLT